MTLQLLWLEYRTVHPNGYQCSWFCERYKAWREQLDVVMRQVYRAGENAFVDYAGPKFPVVDRSTGEVCGAMVFVGVLGASNYTFVDVTWSRALPGLDDVPRPDVRVLGRRAAGMAQPCEEQTAMPDISELSFEDRLSLLLEREKTDRAQRRYQRLKGLAKLHLDATIEDLNFKAPRGLDRSLVLRLASGQ